MGTIKAYDVPESLKPLLKWAGGKRWFVQKYYQILKNFKNHRIVEPFAGGIALSLGLLPQKALINDINPHLINLYTQIKKNKFKIPQEITLTKSFYYKTREEFNELILNRKIKTLKAAQLFWILNRIGYNGLCRFNQQGFFNTPFGHYKKISTDFNINLYSKIFEDWSFESCSFNELNILEGDFVFCDPPYDHSWRGYTKETFDFESQIELAKWAKLLGVPVLITNHATKKIKELYGDLGFELSYTLAPRSISADALKRKPCEEIIASHNFSWKQILKRL